MTPQEQIQHVLATRGLLLRKGAHGNCAESCCLLEAVNLARTGAATDSPSAAGMPDLRSLNDAAWSSDELRTQHCVPVAVALWDWSTWDVDRQQRFAELLAIGVIREILPVALDATGLKTEAEVCRKAVTLSEAQDAAYAARAARAARAADAPAAAYAAAYAARAADAADAADAAAYAAYAADAAAYAAARADVILITSCALWVRCAQESV